MDNRHAIVPYGTKRMNWANRHNLLDTFTDANGKTVDAPKSAADGIHFGSMDGDAPGGIVFRVGDVTLDNEVPVDWDNWQPNDRGVSPAGKRIGEQLAVHILDAAIERNPNQADELENYRRQIRL